MTLTKQQWYGIIAAVIVVALGLAGFNILKALKAEREQAMIYQLSQLREAVMVFEKTTKTRPADLRKALVVSIGGKAVPIQWSFKKDGAGNPVDPFGAPYQYDARTGWVKSGTKGYESW